MGRLSLTIIPTFHRGMRGLGDVKAGSEIAVGFKYSTGGLFEVLPDTDYTIATITGCLYGTGAFSSVFVETTGGIFSNYLTIKATLSTGFNQVEDIGGLIEGRIRECYPQFAPFIQSRDSVAVIKVPQDPTIPKAAVEIPAGTPGGLPAPVPSIADSLLSSLGLNAASSAGGSSLTKLIIPIGLAVLIAKAFK
jgi:hypothetical protein